MTVNSMVLMRKGSGWGARASDSYTDLILCRFRILRGLPCSVYSVVKGVLLLSTPTSGFNSYNFQKVALATTTLYRPLFEGTHWFLYKWGFGSSGCW